MATCLSDGPWPLSVHCGIGAPGVRELSGKLYGVVLSVLSGVHWFHMDTLKTTTHKHIPTGGSSGTNPSEQFMYIFIFLINILNNSFLE